MCTKTAFIFHVDFCLGINRVWISIHLDRYVYKLSLSTSKCSVLCTRACPVPPGTHKHFSSVAQLQTSTRRVKGYCKSAALVWKWLWHACRILPYLATVCTMLHTVILPQCGCVAAIKILLATNIWHFWLKIASETISECVIWNWE